MYTECVRCGQRFVPGKAERTTGEIRFVSDHTTYMEYKPFNLCLSCSFELKCWLKRGKRTCDGDEFC